jgi:NAD(P)-dependent dehydrogenase (short-subunit alcohol dehydrogenase family)
MVLTGKLQGKVALVAGGAGEIGIEVCLRFAKEGASVVIVDIASGNQLTAKIGEIGGKAVFVRADLSKTTDVVNAFDKAVETYGALHIVINLVGVNAHTPTFETTSDEEWDRVFLINCRGTFLVAREAAKRLGPGGRIVLTSSQLAQNPMPGELPSLDLLHSWHRQYHPSRNSAHKTYLPIAS